MGRHRLTGWAVDTWIIEGTEVLILTLALFGKVSTYRAAGLSSITWSPSLDRQEFLIRDKLLSFKSFSALCGRFSLEGLPWPGLGEGGSALCTPPTNHNYLGLLWGLGIPELGLCPGEEVGDSV